MAWAPVQDSSILHSLSTPGLTAGTIELVDSRIVGTDAEVASWTYVAFLQLPVGTQIRVTVESYSCANPNPTPGTPSSDYKPGIPSVEWTTDAGTSAIYNVAYPYSLVFGEDWPYSTPWPTDAPTVETWTPADSGTGTVDISDPEQTEHGIGLWLFGGYVDATDNPGPNPTSFAVFVEVWDEGYVPPGDGCFWTDLVVAEQDCEDEPPGEYLLSFLAKRHTGGVFRTSLADWCDPAFTLLSDALESGTVQLTRVWPITTLADDPLAFDFCGDTWTNPGITAITAIAAEGGGGLTLDPAASAFETSNELIEEPGDWFSHRCVVELTVNGSETIYGYYDGPFTV
ncbi:MAG TPA: hypothetical protein VGE09_06270 [Pseudoxanthomonas sp.]